MTQVLNGAEAVESVLGAGAQLYCNTQAGVSPTVPWSWGLGLGQSARWIILTCDHTDTLAEATFVAALHL